MAGCTVHKMILADEVGVAYARKGEVVLRSAFQPIYALHGKRLRAVAAESFLRPFVDGTPVPPRAFLESLDPAERASTEMLAMNLHGRNICQFDVENVDHVLGISSVAAASGLGELCQAPASGVIASVRAPLEVSDWRVPKTLRETGLPLMLGGASHVPPDPDTIRHNDPAIVRLGGGWFRRVAEVPAASVLLARLVDGLQAQGIRVAIEGIETPRQLGVAIDAGADLFQGFLLGRPELAGTAIARAEIALDSLFATSARVVSLFANGPFPASTHQSR